MCNSVDTWADVFERLTVGGMPREAVACHLGIPIDRLDTLAVFRLPQKTHAGLTGLGVTSRAIGVSVESLRERFQRVGL